MPLRVGITSDLQGSTRAHRFAQDGLAALEASGLKWEMLPAEPEISATSASSFDALLVGAPRVGAGTLTAADRLMVVARLGVGRDNVDLDACREHGVLVTVTPDAVRRPMASAALALILALAHDLPAKDSLVRQGRWHERGDHVGVDLRDRTLGLVGFGNIGQDVARLAQPFGMRVIAFTPTLTDETAAEAGVERADLEDLLAAADVVCVACPLTPETRHLIDRDRLALMKESAFLINIARGEIIDQHALVEALREHRIRAAGLDVFAQEPLSPDDPLVSMENVILAPHALGFVDRLMIDAWSQACASILDVANGRTPKHMVDPQTWQHPLFRQKLKKNS